MTVTVLKLFQVGFRLFRGEDLNSVVNQVNLLSVVNQSSVSQTALTTAGAGTILAAALLSGLVVRSGPTGAFTDTTDTGTAIDTALGAAAQTGVSILITYKNTTAFAGTITGGTGVTVSGRTVVNPNSTGTYLLTRTGAGTYTFFGVDVVNQSIFGVAGLVATADNGTTQTLTAAMVVGGLQTYHTSTGGSTPSLTLPLGTDMDTALPDMRVGQSFVLRVINTNSGNTTIVTNTGWTFSGGTLVLATNTWKEFLITKTATATYTGVNVGSGTFV